MGVEGGLGGGGGGGGGVNDTYLSVRTLVLQMYDHIFF